MSNQASPGRTFGMTFNSLQPTGGPQGCQKIGGSLYVSYIDPNESEFTGEFLVTVLTSLLEGKTLVINSKMTAGNRTVYEDNNPMNPDGEYGEYSNFSFSFGSTYIEDADKFVASIGIGSGSVIDTYLIQYNMVVTVSSPIS